MKVLVTGGAGFIGSNLCRRLVREPEVDEVRVVDDLSTGRMSNLNGVDVGFHHASVLDKSVMREAAAGVRTIIHLAALGSVPRSLLDPRATHDANATGTLMVLEAARAAGAHVILASSSSVYGANPVLPKEESQLCMPVSPYAVTKLAAEQYAMAYAQSYGLAVLPFRFFNVYGPMQAADHAYAAVIPIFVDRALRGLPLPVHGDGLQSRDFTFVDTVVDVIWRATREGVTGDPTNLAFGTNTTLLDLVSRIRDAVGRDVEIEHQPPRGGDVRASQADNTRLRGLLGEITSTDLDVGLAATIEWMSAQHAGAARLPSEVGS